MDIISRYLEANRIGCEFENCSLLWPSQEDHNYVIVNMPRRTGKTTLLCQKLLNILINPPRIPTNVIVAVHSIGSINDFMSLLSALAVRRGIEIPPAEQEFFNRSGTLSGHYRFYKNDWHVCFIPISRLNFHLNQYVSGYHLENESNILLIDEAQLVDRIERTPLISSIFAVGTSPRSPGATGLFTFINLTMDPSSWLKLQAVKNEIIDGYRLEPIDRF